jgi:uncharacterized membrane protein YebE (DUF533 family)
VKIGETREETTERTTREIEMTEEMTVTVVTEMIIAEKTDGTTEAVARENVQTMVDLETMERGRETNGASVIRDETRTERTAGAMRSVTRRVLSSLTNGAKILLQRTRVRKQRN